VLTLEKIRRLGQMSLPELRFRLAQQLRITAELWTLDRDGRTEASAWWHFWDAQKVAHPALREALLHGLEAEATRLLPDYFAVRSAPMFSPRLTEAEQFLEGHHENFPQRAEQLRDEAETLCARRFRIFSYPEVNCGEKIPWRRDWIHGIESGLDHWSRIPYLEFERVGDSKIVWEPNRHQHFLTLGQAYRVTGDERFAEECLVEWEDWQEQNPWLRGINWASSLELSFRACSWLWMLHLLAGSRALTGVRLARITGALSRHAAFIAENLSTYFSPNTHLLGEGFALFVIGLLLPELRGAEKFCRTGRAILLEGIHQQVAEDGSHIEQSSYYHHYATDFFLCAAILADQNQCPFPEDYRRQLERMVEFLLHGAWPCGRHPMTGDADGGRVLALASRDPNDHRSTLSTAAVYFRRGDFKARAGSFREETLWLMGPEAGREFARLKGQPPQKTSRVFANAGLVSMRGGWADDSALLLFDAGPQGMGPCAHGHADALSVLCSARGVDWLIDPGTFVYTCSLQWRDFFRSTAAHNTVVVDGCSQAKPVDVFKWREIPRVHLERSKLLPSLDFAIASHDGYARLRDPVLHRRTVLFAKPDYWVVSDELTGRGQHTLEFLFHFSPGVRLEPTGDSWLASKKGGRLLLATPAIGLDFRVAVGEESPPQGWYSEDYGHREPAPVLIGTMRSALPARADWILCPEPTASLRVRELPGPDLCLAVETDSWSDFLALRKPSSQTSTAERFTDAEALFLRQAKSGQLERLAIVNGSRAEIDSQLLVQADRIVDALDVNRREDRVEILLPLRCRLRLYLPGVSEARVNGKRASFVRDGGWIELLGEG
jgi:hypothetical protein